MRYEEPEMEIVQLEKEDILTLVSGPESGVHYTGKELQQG